MTAEDQPKGVELVEGLFDNIWFDRGRDDAKIRTGGRRDEG